MNEPILKVPPHSLEAEQSLLGALLLDNQAHDRVSFIKAEHFYRDDHRRIWRHISKLVEHNRPADMMTVGESIESSEDKDRAGGPAYLALLAQNTPSALNIRRYAEIVLEKATLRDLAQRATEIAERALGGIEESMAIVEDAAGVFLGIHGDRDSGDFSPFGKFVAQAVETADNPRHGLSTGLPDLDAKVGPLMPGDFIVVAARPSMGKTALAVQIGEHISAKHHAAVFSVEMTGEKIAARLLRYHASILGRDGAVDHLDSLNLHVDESSGLTLGQARARLRRLKRKHDIRVAVFDYLQLMSAKAEKRHEEVAVISRGLKAIAKDLGIPVIAVVQLNRGPEARLDNRPMMSDLRESGQIEQDADVVLMLYRDDYYRPSSEWVGITEAIVRKNRDGATGTAYLEWVGQYTRFKTLERALPMPSSPSPAAPRRTVVKGDFKRAAAGDG